MVDTGAAVEDAGDARVLRQVAESALRRILPGRLVGAAEHLEQAGLTGPVAADETDLVHGHDGEGRVFQETATADLQRKSRHL